ncbi:alpha/beta fold hydrolase [Bosea lathyri]|uniref:Pimeloyl-ACP methyl ester carboxylesterase n=1 Tax=Bosea lathyri TaxID=1036778 RepID=A0A1H5ZJA0_9HYPH|nr:alpha/beta hydrolase [Bosea lathyri]SEG36074.1 Pimeloyl-ACP methyl ester carboxylesterase [Bosea lathyri]
MTARTRQVRLDGDFVGGMRELTFRGDDGWPLLAKIGEVNDAGLPPLVMLHAGGPDHHMLLPLAQRLGDSRTIVLPDIRGYGRSHCTDPARHRWSQYAQDVVALIDHLGFRQVDLLGVGLGATIAMRAAIGTPERFRRAALISVEDIEDDADKEKEKTYLAAFAKRVREQGIAAGWEPILAHFPPIVGRMVRDAIPRSDAASITAAAAIGNDRSFRHPEELAALTAPTLIIPGIDTRHPRELAEKLAAIMPAGELSSAAMTSEMTTEEDFADALAPEIARFLGAV